MRASRTWAGGIHDSGMVPAHSSSRRWRESSWSVLARFFGPRNAGRVGGLGQVGLDPGGLKFLDHEPPPGAALDCERGRLTVELLKPPAELDSRRRTDLAAVNLAGLGLHMVERDLLSVHVKPTYDRHSGPPRAPVLLAHRSLLRLTPRGPPLTCHLWLPPEAPSPGRHRRDPPPRITHRNYEWVFEADITACFDEIDHTALMGRVRRRIGDKRVLGRVKAFLRAGILTEEGLNRETITGTPQGGILSPLLANIALSVLDEHFAAKWEALGPEWTRAKHRRAGVPVMRLVRYADDFVVMVAGTRDDAEALWDEVGSVLAPMGLRLSEEKTRVCHIDEGFDFLGWRIQRRAWRGRTGKTSDLHLSVQEGARLDDRTRCDRSPAERSIERSPTCCAG